MQRCSECSVLCLLEAIATNCNIIGRQFRARSTILSIATDCWHRDRANLLVSHCQIEFANYFKCIYIYAKMYLFCFISNGPRFECTNNITKLIVNICIWYLERDDIVQSTCPWFESRVRICPLDATHANHNTRISSAICAIGLRCN